MNTAGKILNSLIVLVGPVILILTQYWGVFVPDGFGDLLTLVFQILLTLFGSVVTLFVSVPKALEMRPRWINKILRG